MAVWSVIEGQMSFVLSLSEAVVIKQHLLVDSIEQHGYLITAYSYSNYKCGWQQHTVFTE